MLTLRAAIAPAARCFSTSAPSNMKVAILGASGGIGQPLSLLMKQHADVTKLALYDIQHTKGVAADLSHINTPAQVTGYVGDSELGAALKGADIVLIPAGVPRKPGMTRDDLFNINAGIVMNLAKACAENCPQASICVISNPVNSTVPIVAEVFKKHNVWNPKKVFGVTTLDSLRASTFIAQATSLPPSTIIPVIGGHSGPTIVPLLSQVKGAALDDSARDAYVKRVQYGGDEVVQAKAGGGSATLSMAAAGARFASSLLRGIKGEKNVVEPAFVESSQMDGVTYAATMVTLGPNGADKIAPVGSISEYEQTLVKACVSELAKNISKGEEFVKAKF